MVELGGCTAGVAAQLTPLILHALKGVCGCTWTQQAVRHGAWALLALLAFMLLINHADSVNSRQASTPLVMHASLNAPPANLLHPAYSSSHSPRHPLRSLMYMCPGGQLQARPAALSGASPGTQQGRAHSFTQHIVSVMNYPPGAGAPLLHLQVCACHAEQDCRCWFHKHAQCSR